MVSTQKFGDNGYRVTISQSKRKETQGEFEATQDRAIFQLEGHDQFLRLDGKIERCLLNKFRKAHKLVTDFSDLGEQLPNIRRAIDEVEQKSSRKSQIDLGTGNDWNITRHSNGNRGGSYILENKGLGRTEQFVIVQPKADGGGLISLLTKSSDGKIAHQVDGCYFHGCETRTYPYSESVSLRP